MPGALDKCLCEERERERERHGEGMHSILFISIHGAAGGESRYIVADWLSGEKHSPYLKCVCVFVFC